MSQKNKTRSKRGGNKNNNNNNFHTAQSGVNNNRGLENITVSNLNKINNTKKLNLKSESPSGVKNNRGLEKSTVSNVTKKNKIKKLNLKTGLKEYDDIIRKLKEETLTYMKLIKEALEKNEERKKDYEEFLEFLRTKQLQASATGELLKKIRREIVSLDEQNTNTINDIKRSELYKKADEIRGKIDRILERHFSSAEQNSRNLLWYSWKFLT